jgi:hypothetical protein
MKMMFNSLDRSFELSNSRYGREAREVLCFAKHHSLTLYIYRERESLKCNALHGYVCAPRQNLKLQVKNN